MENLNIQESTVGKNIIEVITLAMYEDARIIYREYIQNSADQIDKALVLGIFSSIREGEIIITIDKEKRTIVIYDNATGIKINEAATTLKDIANSKKDRIKNKGFRGIGRLGGLAYCERLTFETSYKGESQKTFMHWDANKLRSIIADNNNKDEVHDVVDKITRFSSEYEESESHYFKVTLEGVTNDLLLDKSEIRKYLESVAPLPFHSNFLFRETIKKTASEKKVNIDEYKVLVNGQELFKSCNTVIKDNTGKGIDELTSVEFLEAKDEEGNMLFWGWYGISEFKGRIKNNEYNLSRGLRLRKSNIQMGNESCLVKLHKEQKGNFYFIGEIYGEHSELIPNARRDYFEDNDILKLFEAKLKSEFLKLYKLYYFASNTRSSLRIIQDLSTKKKIYEEQSTKGFANAETQKKLQEQVKQAKEKAIKEEEKIDRVKENLSKEETAKIEIFKNLTKNQVTKTKNVDIGNILNVEKVEYRTDKLSKLDKSKQQLIRKVFAVIQKMLDPKKSEELIQAIEQELK